MNLRGLEVPLDSALISSNAPSWLFNFSYSLSRKLRKCSKVLFLFANTTFFWPRSAYFNAINDSCKGILSWSVLESKQKSWVHVSFDCIVMTAFHFPFPVFEYFEGIWNLFPPPERKGKAFSLTKNKIYNMLTKPQTIGIFYPSP